MAHPHAADLTRNEQLVLAVLNGTSGAQSAYELLDRLRSAGVRAPTTIYRALEGLVRKGFAHKVHSLNAYIACSSPGHGHVQLFRICDSCGAVDESQAGEQLAQRIQDNVGEEGFRPDNAVLEVHGRCADCATGWSG